MYYKKLIKIAKQKKSISMIELLIAIVILSVGVVFMVKSFLSMSSALTYTNNKLQAINYLNETVGKIQNDIFNGEKLSQIKHSRKFQSNNREFNCLITEIKRKESLVASEESRPLRLLVTWKEGSKEKKQELVVNIKIKGEQSGESKK